MQKLCSKNISNINIKKNKFNASCLLSEFSCEFENLHIYYLNRNFEMFICKIDIQILQYIVFMKYLTFVVAICH